MKLIIILSIICTILSYLLGYYIGRVTYIPNKIIETKGDITDLIKDFKALKR